MDPRGPVALSITTSELSVGIDNEAIQKLLEADLTERDVKLAIASSYGRYIRDNEIVLDKNEPIISSCILTLFAGLGFISIGVYVAFIDIFPILIAILFAIFIAIVVINEELDKQIFNFVREVDWEEKKTLFNPIIRISRAKTHVFGKS